MHKVIGQLLELEKVDNKIMELENKYSRLPELLKEIDQEIDEKEKLISAKDADLQEKKSEYSKVLGKTEEKKILLKKFEEQLMMVKNNKEYKAAQSEIVNTKMEIARFDEQALALLEIIEEKEEVLKTEKDTFNSYKAEKEIEKQKNTEEFSGLDDEIQKYRAESDKIREKIEDKRIIQDYDRIFKRNRGSAISKVVHGNACGGCFMLLRPQLLVEIRKLDKLSCCDSCGRFLYWDATSAE